MFRTGAVLAVAGAAALGLTVLAPGAAGGQEPEQEPAEEVSGAPPLSATWLPPRLAFTLSFGTLGIGALQTQPVLAQRLGPDGTTVTATDTLGRTVQADGGLHLTGSALLGFSPRWAVRLSATLGRAELGAEYSGASAEEQLVRKASEFASRGTESLSIAAAEATLLYRFRSGRRLKPYGLLGVSAVAWETDPGAAPLAGTAPLAESTTRVAGLAGVGGVFPLSSRLAAQVEVSGRFHRVPLPAAADSMHVATGDSLNLIFAAPRSTRFGDSARDLLRVLRLDAGLTLELGRVIGPPGS